MEIHCRSVPFQGENGIFTELLMTDSSFSPVNCLKFIAACNIFCLHVIGPSTLEYEKMVCLGKRCPCCGGKKMMSRGQNSWMERTSFAAPLVCTECGERLISYGLCTISAEQRRHNRFLLPASFLLRIPGDCPQFARIKNISQGGIRFDNLSCSLPAHTTLRVDIFNCNTGTGIEQLPVEIIAPPEKNPATTTGDEIQTTKGARFLNLTQAQKKLLADCIQTNGRQEEILPVRNIISQ